MTTAEHKYYVLIEPACIVSHFYGLYDNLADAILAKKHHEEVDEPPMPILIVEAKMNDLLYKAIGWGDEYEG